MIAKFYANRIKKGLTTMDNVPFVLREDVQTELDKLGDV